MSDKTNNITPVSYHTFLFPFIFSDHGVIGRGKFEKCLADGWYLDVADLGKSGSTELYNQYHYFNQAMHNACIPSPMTKSRP